MAGQGDEWTPPGAPASPQAGQSLPRSTGQEAPPRFGVRVPSSAPDTPPQAVAVAPLGGGNSSSGWTPPPKPGLIPLHPLGFGTLLGTAFSAIRWNARALVAPAVVVSLLQSAISVLGLQTTLIGVASRFFDASDADRQAIVAGGVGQLLLASGAVLAVSTVFTALMQGLVVVVVARGALGQKPTIRAVLARVGRRFWRLLLYSLLESVALVVGFTVIAGLAALLGVAVGVAAGQTAGVVLAIVLLVLGALGGIVLTVWIGVRIAVAPSVIVLERAGIVAAVRRSWRLTRGSFWRTFGLIALPRLIIQVVAGVISLPFQLLGSLLTTLVLPNGATGDTGALLQTSILAALPASAVTAIVAGIGLIAEVAAIALLYIDLRMRTDGLDIRLRTLVESGEVGEQDPYGPPPA
ncbi:hypothetical protein [uncultured Amnibacterium sp.]|uniref:hypothetical protein n=1 Tax=uncultured Amnibacterium sp. TaxID=1631851 RepID=UPI0035CC2CF6